ncbi:translational activator of cytochrome c oxidase 1 [Latimeria chalumnae]|uniref:Translational activator of cytochrome c oxidase 1 n=1 Tax=Latimeria chalumnae TaxID=7897 RepID=H3AVX1_LATCH|nr:PREDICTED: translational activator of cytochrome c oxidase 1 [Latimeria chalumnae]XP_005994668.1 PREDICTED: translational activator of cytochrome c oxidase 1 [Latimeria chalumnae]|eukprot:XP_005994667.1 PREDICTED: translational activator of cytochrome c oxidase 1 [Latimeria chalumnae]
MMFLTSIFQSACSMYGKHLLSTAVGNQKPLFKQYSTLSCLLVPCHQLGLIYTAFQQFTTVHTSAAISAGHNKWSKVKHVKGPKDAAKSLMFMKLSMLLRLAVKEGGPNPDSNVQLANIIEQCRAKNMPKASIEAAIKGMEKTKETHLLYEGRGPGGCSLLIEVLTDNNSRSYQEVKFIMNKNGGMLCDGARHCFEKKGVVTVNCKNIENQLIEPDRALELGIEVGAEDVNLMEDEDNKPVFQFICDVSSLREVRAKLDSMGLLTKSAGLEFIPNTTVQLSEAELDMASHLIEMITGCQDVIKVNDNIESQN